MTAYLHRVDALGRPMAALVMFVVAIVVVGSWALDFVASHRPPPEVRWIAVPTHVRTKPSGELFLEQVDRWHAQVFFDKVEQWRSEIG